MYLNAKIPTKNINHFKIMFFLTFYQKININIKSQLLKSKPLTLNSYGLNFHKINPKTFYYKL